MHEILKIQELNKQYVKNGPFAVKDVSFECNAGEIVGLIGHNGAGKSTTLKCLLGMLTPTSGEIFIDGASVAQKPLHAKRNLGFVTDNHSVFLRMTGMQYLSFMADVYGVKNKERKERFEYLESIFRLGDSLNNLISTYSHGMKQKICIMGSVLHEPLLWVLDEPLVGLDPKTAKAVTDFMLNYAQKGKCILFSSHNLDMVAKICDKVLMIKNGSLVLNLDIKEFSAANPGADLEEHLRAYED